MWKRVCLSQGWPGRGHVIREAVEISGWGPHLVTGYIPYTRAPPLPEVNSRRLDFITEGLGKGGVWLGASQTATPPRCNSSQIWQIRGRIWAGREAGRNWGRSGRLPRRPIGDSPAAEPTDRRGAAPSTTRSQVSPCGCIALVALLLPAQRGPKGPEERTRFLRKVRGRGPH